MQRRKFLTKKELTQKLTHRVPDKNKRIIVVQFLRTEYPLPKMRDCVEHLIKYFDDSVKLMFMVVEEIVGDKQVYDISGVDDDVVKAVAEESKKCLKLLKQVKK